jgi:hypothetical protein
MATKKNEVIEITPIRIKKATLRIVGDSPLIVHAWSEKAKREMLDKQMGKNQTKKKAAKNPVEDFINSMYWMTEKPQKMDEESYEEAIANGAKFGFPVSGLKQSAISAAYRMGWVKDKMGLRGTFFIDADEDGLIEIKGDAPIMREDMVKVGMGTADIRYRGEIRNWYADITISYNELGKFNLQDIINVLNAGGFVCGLGEWRPERDGQYGMFHVEISG